ncbi:MAG: tRNA 2-thiouridine(34) synthase MnmA [Deltaproteobacteria bacterium]|nr:tRNA 2-thiouridine(34) synthase MnmA [Deltaproteobacteria bacterium]
MRIAVAMSGGVDSLRSAVLLKEQGGSVCALHMRLPAQGDLEGDEDGVFDRRVEKLRELTARFSIPLTVVDMRQAFEEKVIRPFLKAYLEGCTPNPCVVCNSAIKFGLLLEEALKQGADVLATGHYARVLRPHSPKGRFALLRGEDLSKDQSYFLFQLTQQQLSRILLPLGSRTKQETVEWAMNAGVRSFFGKESQEICFIPSGNYQEFLRRRLGLDPSARRGSVIDVQGNLVGEHNGVFGFTVGQRRGLGIASSAPYYVVALDPVANVVRVGRSKDLLCREFGVGAVNWVSIKPPVKEVRVGVRIRHQHAPAPATVLPRGEEEAVVLLDEPQQAVTPGQAAVFYDGDTVVGGGTIKRG